MSILVDSYSVPVISGPYIAPTAPTGGQTLYPLPPPPDGGLVVVTGTEPAPGTAAAGNGYGCCSKCRKGAPGTSGGVVVSAAAGAPGATAGPLAATLRAPLPWWVYVLVGFAVGRLFRG